MNQLFKINSKGASLLVVVSILLISSCNKSSLDTENRLEPKYKSSITFVNDKYKIDTNVIVDNLNKQKLLKGIAAEKFSEKKTTVEIPGFILDFLNKTNSNGTFKMAGVNEAWNNNNNSLGQLAPTKVFDEFAQDSVVVLVKVNANLPDKQLIYFGFGKKYAMLSYYTSDRGNSQQVAMFEHCNNKITDFWFTRNLKFAKTKIGLINNIKNASVNIGGC